MVACLMLVLGTGLRAQDKDKDKAKEKAKEKEPAYTLRSAVRLGYTKPGFPDDKLAKDGSVLQVAWDDQYSGKVLGGTVYFMVLERTGAEGDTWGAGMDGVDSRFVAGKNRRGQFSPKLDRKAKYLYLYQLVNDRGMETPKILPAGEKDLNVSDIAGTSLNLIVDPRFITSWGHFKGTGFVMKVKEKDARGEIVSAADGSSSEIILAASSDRSVLDALPEKMYKYRSPAYSLGDVTDTFNIGAATLNLKATAQYKQVADVATPVNYQANRLKAADNVKEPDYVTILYAGTPERVIPVEDPEEGENPILAVFRAEWREAESFVKLGYHSVVYGFTSDLPPTDEVIRLEDPEAVRRLEGGRAPVKAPGRNGTQRSRPQGGQGVVPAVAPGTAPTPAPAAGGTGVGGAGLLGGGMSGPGAAGGAVPALTPTVGMRPAGGFGQFGGQQGEDQGQDVGQQGNVTVNVNPVMTNTQSQSQAQSQSQTQGQVQQQLPPPVKPPKHDHKPPTHCPKGEVVPEPAAIVLGLLGLPALYWIRRRRQAAGLPA